MSDSNPPFDYLQLTVAQRIILVQEIWDSLAEDLHSAPFTPAQKEELDRRVAAAERGELTFSPWEEVKQRLFRPE